MGLSKEQQAIQKQERLGTVFNTVENGRYTVIDYLNANNIIVLFDCGSSVKTTWANAKNHLVRNPNKETTVQGISVITSPEYNTKHKYYPIWRRMINRCYGKTKHSSYDNVYVCEEWKNFITFAKWCDIHYIQGFELDKDLLTDEKFYSPDTCCFIPHEINVLLTYKNNSNGLPKGVSWDEERQQYQARCKVNGVYKGYRSDSSDDAFNWYKQIKEETIKEIALKWKGKIPDKIYYRLLTYEIN